MNRFTVKKRSWQESFEALKRYKERHGNTLVPVHNCKEDPALGGWVNHQRSKKDKLSDEQRQLLDSIGFAWSCRNRNKTWNPMIDALKQFKKIHGHCDVPEQYQADQKLADFVKEQRAKYNRGQLSTARMKQLEEIGLALKEEEEEEDDAMEEDEDENSEDGEQDEEEGEEKRNGEMILYDSAFKQQYQKLVDYHIKYGHCRVPKFSRRGDTLGLWVASLKRKYDENPENAMEPRCFELLEELDFFNAPAPAPAPFKKRLSSGLSRRLPISKPTVKPSAANDNEVDAEVDAEVDEDDDEEEEDTGMVVKAVKLEDVQNVQVDVASDDDSDVSSDGDNEEDGNDSDDEDDKSDAGSATSSSSGSDNDTDNENDETMKSSGAKRRHSEISQTSSQRNRANYRDERFMKQFQDLLAFKKQFGHCRVPQSKKWKTLGGWVNNLRVVYNRDPENGVRPDRKEMLDTVGFIWNAGADRPGNDARWEEQYKHLLEFKTKFGHCRVPQTGPHRKLGRWVATQRALYVKDPENGIRPDRLKRLNDIEFTWDAKGYKGRHFYSIASGPGQKPTSTEEKKPPKAMAAEAIKAESDATESDDDDGVVAAQVDEDAPRVKVENGGEAWVGPVDAVAIPSSAVDTIGEAAVQVKVEADAAVVAGAAVQVKVEDNAPVAAEPVMPVKAEEAAPVVAETAVQVKVEDDAPVAAQICQEAKPSAAQLPQASDGLAVKIELAPESMQAPASEPGTVESKPLVHQVSVD